ncbi:MAG: hypothetical protein R3182_12110 [Draconibacterium sp.]|nr:hypothetical protein [Draconibacterium sp.]
MIDISLQIWGGLFYLLNKVFFSQAERSKTINDRKIWRIRSWIVYLAGLPAWVVVFISEHNWIVAGVESGGAPAMLVGLIIALRGHGAEPKWLDSISKISVLVGLALSVYEFGGIKNLSQLLELGIAAGFLMGTYMMAMDNAQGYLWLMLGNVSCASLMGIEGYFIFMTQQLVSLAFVTDAFLTRRKKRMLRPDRITS